MLPTLSDAIRKERLSYRGELFQTMRTLTVGDVGTRLRTIAYFTHDYVLRTSASPHCEDQLSSEIAPQHRDQSHRAHFESDAIRC